MEHTLQRGRRRLERRRQPLRDAVKALVAFIPPAAVRRLPSAALRGRLLWWIQASLERWPRGFTCETPQGFTMNGSTRDIIQRFVYVYGVWEPEITAWTRSFLRPGDAALDIGANCGYHTLLFARTVGEHGTVVSVEAVPSIFGLLVENVRGNGLTNVVAHCVAAGDEGGEIEVFRSDAANLGWSGSLPSAGSVSEGLVSRRRIADLVDDDVVRRLRLVKIDTEGDELRALRGLEDVLSRVGPGTAVVVEVTPEKLAARSQGAEGVFDLLRSHGFAPYRFVSADTAGAAPELEPLPAIPSGQADVVFVKQD